MANYNCVIRTNMFRVKDADAFREFMKTVYGSEDAIQLWEETIDGVPHFGFGCYGGIAGLAGDNYDADDYDEYDMQYDGFIEGLQKHVDNSDAILICEVGHEKLRYVQGTITIVTAWCTEVKDLTTEGNKTVKSLLKNWELKW